MSSWEKLVVHSANPIFNLSFDDGRSFSISRTKYDDLLLSFATSDSLSSRFVEKIAQSDIMRTFLFLEGDKIPQANYNFPIRQIFPLVLNPQYGLEELLVGPYKSKREEAEKKSKESSKSLNETFAAASFDFLETSLQNLILSKR